MASSFHFAVANLVLFFGLACSQPGQQYPYCNPLSVIPAGSPVSDNLNNVLAAMTHASQLNSRFSALSSGVGANTVFGLANCLGAASLPEHCISCIQDAIRTIQKRCPNKSDAQIWYNDCIVRYSQENFFGTFDNSRASLDRNEANYTDPESLFSRLGPLFDIIINEVARDANNGVATEKTALPGGDTLYGGAACTEDLGPVVCTQCVRVAVRLLFDSFCKSRKGCTVLLSSCFVAYEIWV